MQSFESATEKRRLDLVVTLLFSFSCSQILNKGKLFQFDWNNINTINNILSENAFFLQSVGTIVHTHASEEAFIFFSVLLFLFN